MNKIFFIFSILILALTSCTIEAEKINYASDACHYCKMSIVDTQHSAQYVTAKGKQFKFDAVECMLNDFSEKSTQGIEIILVADYSNPGLMIDATKATYLISSEIQSPMGAYLSTFSVKEKAEELVLTPDDKLFTWSTIKEKYEVE